MAATPSASRRQRAPLFTVGPIEKLLLYQRIPFKLLCNLCILLMLLSITVVYVAPLLAVLTGKVHTLSETLLTPGDELPESYQSKWHGDYVDTARVLWSTVDDVEAHIYHVVKTLAAFGDATETLLWQLTLAARPAVAPGDITLPTVPSTLSWSTSPGSVADCAGTNPLCWGIAVQLWLSESSSSVGLWLESSSDDSTAYQSCLGPTNQRAVTLPSGATVQMQRLPCLSQQWLDLLAGDDTQVNTTRVLRSRRLLQLASRLSVTRSWDQASDGGGNSLHTKSLRVRWSAAVSWVWLDSYRTAVRSVVETSYATARSGFFSSDDEMSANDGLLSVALIFGIFAGALWDLLLRVRALRVIAQHDDAENERLTHTADAGSGDSTSEAVQDGDEEEEEEGTVMLPQRTQQPLAAGVVEDDRNAKRHPWHDFLLRGKGAAWHKLAIACDGLLLAFGIVAIRERAGFDMHPSHWTALQLFLAYGTFGHSVGLLGFMRFSPQAYLLTRATRRSMARLLALIAGVLPIFFGFAALLTIAFGRSSLGEFETLHRSLVALVFMMFGDNLLPAFRKMDGSRYWWMRAAADAAGCAYVVVFMSVVLNLSIAVVVETYHETRVESQQLLLEVNGDAAETDGTARDDSVGSNAQTLRRHVQLEIKKQLAVLRQLNARCSVQCEHPMAAQGV